MLKILGISAFYHDSAASIIIDGKIIAAAQEERFNREKNTADFPKNAIKYCLDEAKISLCEIDTIIFYEKPFLKFERLIQTYYAVAPKGLMSFLKAMPGYLSGKLFLKKTIHSQLLEIEEYDTKKVDLLFSEHHLSHAASAFYSSDFKESAILTIDGVGEWATTSISIGRKNKITTLKEIYFPHSIGLLYSSFTYFLGFEVNSGEYKLMGLAPYGDKNNIQTQSFISKIKKYLLEIKDDGSIWLNQKYFSYCSSLEMVSIPKWEKLFQIQKRQQNMPFNQEHCNLAFAIQHVAEEIILKLVKETQKVTGLENICIAGGVALNCTVNGKILQTNNFKKIYIPPFPGDSGGAIGCALNAYYMYHQKQRRYINTEENESKVYLGPKYQRSEIEKINYDFQTTYTEYTDFNKLAGYIAKEIGAGKIIAWFQGRMEFGPRALGNRSILGDVRNPEIKKILNMKVKKRENFRPFAPSILQEDVGKYFDTKIESPFMSYIIPITSSKRKKKSTSFKKLSLNQKENLVLSDIPGVTHIDFSTRIHTVNKASNYKYWKLLKSIQEEIGIGMVLNTSFNVNNEPIVCSPKDAYITFLGTEIDHLVINNFVYDKNKQAAKYK